MDISISNNRNDLHDNCVGLIFPALKQIIFKERIRLKLKKEDLPLKKVILTDETKKRLYIGDISVYEYIIKKYINGVKNKYIKIVII